MPTRRSLFDPNYIELLVAVRLTDFLDAFFEAFLEPFFAPFFLVPFLDAFLVAVFFTAVFFTPFLAPFLAPFFDAFFEVFFDDFFAPLVELPFLATDISSRNCVRFFRQRCRFEAVNRRVVVRINRK